MIDIHCHLLPGIDDGSSDWNETLEMARTAVADGIETIIVTPHQGGNFAQNQGATIRQLVATTQEFLTQNGVPLRLLPGADVRIEVDMIDRLRSGDIVSLGDRRRHVLLELPHELYFPLEPVLEQLRSIGMEGILSHPERNMGILRDQGLVRRLVEAGCLMQVTAGSLMGTFGPDIQRVTETFLTDGLVHFIATDAHGVRSRRPLLQRAMDRAAELTSRELATTLCVTNPGLVAAGRDVPCVIHEVSSKGFRGWFRRKAG